jgi:hypothetical protein
VLEVCSDHEVSIVTPAETSRNGPGAANERIKIHSIDIRTES